MSERSDSVAALDGRHAGGEVALLRAWFGELSCCLPPTTLARIERTDTLQRSPRRDGGPFGWMLDSEAEIPVYLPGPLLGGGAAAEPPPHGVVVAFPGGDGPWGLRFDRLERVTVARRQILPLPRLPRDAGNLAGRELPFRRMVAVGDTLLPLFAPRFPGGGEAALPRGLGETLRLAASAATGAAAAEPPAASTLRLVVFTAGRARLNGRPVRFGLPLVQVLEAVTPAPVAPLPSSPIYLRGLALWRERAIPVVDLADWVGLPSLSAPVGGRLLVCRVNRAGDLLGLGVEPSLRLVPAAVANRPYDGLLPFPASTLRGCFELEDEILAIPRLDGLLDEEPALGEPPTWERGAV